MAFDVANFVIDRVKRGIMTSTSDGSVMFTINQIEEPSLSVSADEKTAVDAMGTTIASFDTAKNAEFSAQNSLFDMNLLATQMGTTKSVASASSKIEAPVFKEFEIVDGQTTVTIDPKPKSGAIEAIYLLNGDSTMGKKFTAAASAGADKFAYDNTTGTLTLPTGSDIAAGVTIFVMYDAEYENAVEVVGSATEFPRAGRFIMEVLGQDVCDPTTLLYAYVIFPNAKLDSNFEVNFTTDGKHPFTIRANQAYCDKKKTLFKIVIPQIDE